MKKLALSIFTLSLGAAAMAQPLDRSVRPKPGPAPVVNIGTSQDFVLPNGLKVFVVENHKVPAVNYSLILDIEPGQEGNMVGYWDATGELLMAGTKSRTKDQINNEIDAVGASISTSRASMFGNSLKKHQTKMLELMSDILMNPSWPADELEKMRSQTLSGLETQKNEPDAMLGNVTAVVNYGPKHSYGEIQTDATTKAITLDACKQYYNTYWRPNVAYLAIVGDVTLAEVKPLVEQYFGKWQRAEVPVNPLPPVPTPGITSVSMAPRDAAVQSVFNITNTFDLKPGSADVIPARVANTILGGGSAGRLFQNLREAHGWTYGSYSSISEDEHVGNFTAYTKCRNEVTDSAITETLKEIRRMSTETVDATTMANTLMYMTGNFAMSLEDPSRVANFAINIDRYKLPKDYYTNYLKNLNAVTAADVQRVSAKYMNADKANIIVVGNKDEVGKKLEKFGLMKFYDYAGRPLSVSVMQPAPAGVTAATVLQKYVTSIGGAGALTGLKDVKVVRTTSMQGTPLTFTEMRKNGKFKQEISAQGFVVQKKVWNGKSGYEEQQGEKTDLKGDDIADTKLEADLMAEMHPEQYGINRTLRGQEKMNGRMVYVIDATNAAGKKSVEYYDAATGYKVKDVSTQKDDKGAESPVVVEYGDYVDVPGGNGYKVPGSLKVQQGGMNFDMALKTVEVNKGSIADSEFE